MADKSSEMPPPPPPAYSAPTTYGLVTVPPGVSVSQGGIPVPPGNMVRYDVTPVRIICQICQAEVLTRTSSRIGAATFLACGGLVFVGCIFGCCLIPFFVDSLKDTVHTCPNCNGQVGVHKHV